MEELRRIVEQTNSIADPLERIRERQRLTRELYAEPFEAKVNRLIDGGWSVQEIAAETGHPVEQVRHVIEGGNDTDFADADEAEALAVIAEAGLMLVAPSPLAPRIADTQEKLAGTFPKDSEIADRLRRNAQELRRYAPPSAGTSSSAPSPPARSPERVVRARPRGRRERHVARATSSSDSGDDGGGSEPPLAPGLAICPVCTDLEIVRHLCRFCGGLGYVDRERRNRYKRGERP